MRPCDNVAMLIGAHVSTRGIGDGEMGVDAFRLLLADGRLNDVPWIIEVPGEEHRGPDLANINRLRDCAGLPARVLAEPVASR
jgi:endonuclease IV